jgi:hypothetical protein
MLLEDLPGHAGILAVADAVFRGLGRPAPVQSHTGKSRSG